MCNTYFVLVLLHCTSCSEVYVISKASLLQKERISTTREDNQPIKLHLNTLYCMWLTETLLTEAIWFWFWQCTLCIQWHGNAYTKCVVSLFPAPFTARTSEACHRPMTHRRLSAWVRAAIFFSANEDCISANHMARILIWRRISLTSCKHLQYVYAHVHVHVRTMYLKYAPYDWLKYWGMAILVCRKKNRARPRACCTWSVCSRLRLLHVQVRRVTDRWLTIAYRLNSMTNNVVSLFTAPFTAHTIVRRVTDQWLAIDKSTTSYPNEVFIYNPCYS